MTKPKIADPIIGAVWQRCGKLFCCRAVFESGVVSLPSDPLEFRAKLKCTYGEGYIFSPDGTFSLVAGRSHIEFWLSQEKARPWVVTARRSVMRSKPPLLEVVMDGQSEIVGVNKPRILPEGWVGDSLRSE